MKKTCVKMMVKTLAVLLVFGVLLAAAAPARADNVGNLQFLVNKTHTLKSDYVPSDMVYMSNYMDAGSGVMMRRDAAVAMGRMAKDAANQGVSSLYALSGYRSYSTQSWLYDNEISTFRSMGYPYNKAVALAAAQVAPPGASEHQTGLTMDVGQRSGKNNLAPSFGKTKGALWLRENCWRFGFILRYDEGWEEVTGYAFEPWHIRYVGRQHAARIHEDPMPLEEYLQIVRRERLMEALASPTDPEP